MLMNVHAGERKGGVIDVFLQCQVFWEYIENVYKHGRWKKKEERTEGGEKIYIHKIMLIILINITPIEGDECIIKIIMQ